MPCFHNGVAEVFKMMEHGDEINLSSPIKLFPRASLPERSGLLQIISSVLEYRVEKKDCCIDISGMLVLFQSRVASLQPLEDFFSQDGEGPRLSVQRHPRALTTSYLRAVPSLFCPSSVLPDATAGGGSGRVAGIALPRSAPPSGACSRDKTPEGLLWSVPPEDSALLPRQDLLGIPHHAQSV